MAPRKPKDAAPTTPVQNAIAALGRLAKKEQHSGVSYGTPLDQTYRWIDFRDPIRRTPALILEVLFGARGLLAGRMIKLEAGAGVGKSSIIWLFYAIAQQMDPPAWCIHHESEGATAPADFIASFGCIPGQVIQPSLDVRSIDACMNSVDWTAYGIRRPPKNEKDPDVIDPEMKSVIVAGIDSISGYGGNEIDEEGGAMTMGGGGLGFHARCLSQWFRDKWSVQEKRDMLMIAVTQLRAKIEVGGFGKKPMDNSNPNTTIAGTPLNYHSTWRLEMSACPLKLKDAPWTQYGEVVTLVTTRNKLSPKGVKVELPLLWNKGFDLVTPTIDWLTDHSPIQLPNGSVFNLTKKGGGYIDCEILGIKNSKSQEEVLDALYANEAVLMGIREAKRIRGYGFAFETNYQMSQAEIEDNVPEPLLEPKPEQKP